MLGLLQEKVYSYPWSGALLTFFVAQAALVKLLQFTPWAKNGLAYCYLFGALTLVSIALCLKLKDRFLQRLFFVAACVWMVRFFGVAVLVLPAFKTPLSFLWIIFLVLLIKNAKKSSLF